mmetsp:Transcript_85928/g.184164  ORF Transcript_85928/g.184164 Transcript_85928/m.184164 type:complete len:208 (-) Transcript_85928:37-660(-)
MVLKALLHLLAQVLDLTGLRRVAGREKGHLRLEFLDLCVMTLLGGHALLLKLTHLHVLALLRGMALLLRSASFRTQVPHLTSVLNKGRLYRGQGCLESAYLAMLRRQGYLQSLRGRELLLVDANPLPRRPHLHAARARVPTPIHCRHSLRRPLRWDPSGRLGPGVDAQIHVLLDLRPHVLLAAGPAHAADGLAVTPGAMRHPTTTMC